MIEKKTDHFHLFSNGHEYYIDMSSRNLLPKPKYSCYLNGERLGTIEAKHFAQLGGQEYIMESFANDETHDINFQLLFISQLHNIG